MVQVERAFTNLGGGIDQARGKGEREDVLKGVEEDSSGTTPLSIGPSGRFGISVRLRRAV
jgi:hypothetical protein